MEYQQPVGGAPGDPYVDGVVGVSAGSIPPAAAIEHPQREIVSVIEAAGLTPAGGDLTQLLQALTSGWDLPKNVAGSGYLTLPGGILVQWGVVPVIASGGAVNVTFPTTFNDVYAIFLTCSSIGLSSTPIALSVNSTSTASQLVVSNNSAIAQGGWFFAIGG